MEITFCHGKNTKQIKSQIPQQKKTICSIKNNTLLDRRREHTWQEVLLILAEKHGLF